MTEQRIAALLGYDVLEPSKWPMPLIQLLIKFEATEGYEALLKEIFKLIKR